MNHSSPSKPAKSDTGGPSLDAGWKAKLNLPARDSRIRTSVSYHGFVKMVCQKLTPCVTCFASWYVSVVRRRAIGIDIQLDFLP